MPYHLATPHCDDFIIISQVAGNMSSDPLIFVEREWGSGESVEWEEIVSRLFPVHHPPLIPVLNNTYLPNKSIDSIDVVSKDRVRSVKIFVIFATIIAQAKRGSIFFR